MLPFIQWLRRFGAGPSRFWTVATDTACWFTERGELVVIRSIVKHSSSWVHRLFMLVSYLTFEGKISRQTQRLHPFLGVGDLALDSKSMQGFMNNIRQSMAVLTLALVSLVGCDSESRTIGNVNPALVAETKQVLRDLWVGHIFWVRNVVSNNATNNLEERDAAEEEVVANAKQIASTMTPFYGEATSEEFFRLLNINYGAVKEYSEATVAGSKRRQDAALARLASNADDIALFLNGVNPYLPQDTVRALIAAHGAHHVLQINQYKEKEYAHAGATWPAMRQHVYMIADTLTTALVKQFPSKFS